MADSESPLRFLDRDVSLMIYEKYYPSKEAKEWKRLSDDQFKYHLKEYLQRYRLNDIYGHLNLLKPINPIRIIGNNRYMIPSKHYSYTNYLVKHSKTYLEKRKRNTGGYNNYNPSYVRARKYKKEAMNERKRISNYLV
jgi:hypothetical protein